MEKIRCFACRLSMLLAATGCVLVLQGCGGSDFSPAGTVITTTTTMTPPHKRGSGVSEIVMVPGWPDLSGKFPLSFGIKTQSMVYASGMQGSDMTTMKLVPGGVGPETNQTLLNLKALLEAAGSSMQDVVRCSVSLVNLARDFKAMNDAYSKFWPKDPPARVAVQVAALAGTASVEIQCDAALSGTGRKVVDVPDFPDPAEEGYPFSFGIVADGVIYVSGMQGRDMNTGALVSGGIGAETTQSLENVVEVLASAESDAARVTGCSVSLRSIDDFSAMNEAYKAYWPTNSLIGGLPTRVCVQVAEIAGGANVEITCTATNADVPDEEAPKAVKVPGWPDIPGLPFSAAVTAGTMAYISGNQGMDMKTGKLVGGGVSKETSQALEDIREAVEAAGSTLADVTSCEVSLRDMKDFNDMNSAYQAFWPEYPPSRVAVQVSALYGDASVEIKCVAALQAQPKLQDSGKKALVV